MTLRRTKLRLEAPKRFACFLGYANPKYQAEWFHILIADYCQKLFEGKIKKLMLFMPPQHGKSEIISRNFPAWALGRDPDLKIVGSSYSSVVRYNERLTAKNIRLYSRTHTCREA